jgi:pyruvate/2-oxoglutarate dehydrogenase complex dihydrolipoamide dehydrogenase (E3) component
METRFAEMEHLTRFRSEARFVGERTIAIDDETYTAEKVVVATGSRPVVPPVDGIDEVDPLTSADAIHSKRRRSDWSSWAGATSPPNWVTSSVRSGRTSPSSR